MHQDDTNDQPTKRREWLSFFTIVAIVFPILTLGFIGAYGLIVWLTQ
ncbi:periplasmic nitrate reductase, NapE protein [Pseudomonas sp. F1_0610]